MKTRQDSFTNTSETIVDIDDNGYGKSHKSVMKNPEIPLTSKAIYGYLQSYCGNTFTAWPKKERILKDLNISKNTLGKYLKILSDNNYIIRHKKPRGTIYEMVKTVNHPFTEGKLVNLKSLGYGTVSKIAMTDLRLTVASKGLYSYLCSYAGQDNLAYPQRKTILRELNIGLDLFYSSYNLLVNTGYITSVRRANEKGQFISNHYIINDEIGLVPFLSDEDTPISPSAVTLENILLEEVFSTPQESVHGGNGLTKTNIPTPQESVHGDNGLTKAIIPTPQESVHGVGEGEKDVDNSVENYVENFGIGIATTQEPISRQTLYGSVGHPYNKNLTTTNSSTNSIELVTSIILASEESTTELTDLKNRNEIKKLIEYEHIKHSFIKNTELKGYSGHFNDRDTAEKHLAFSYKALEGVVAAIESIAKGSTKFLSTSSSGVIERALLLKYILERHIDFAELCYIISDKVFDQKRIRSMPDYISACLISEYIQATVQT